MMGNLDALRNALDGGAPMRTKSARKTRWHIVLPFALLHIGALVAPFHVTADAVIVAAAMWLATGLFGITVGYHRMLAHRGFQTSATVRAFHLFWGALAFQQGPLSWVRLHRAHHAYSDTEQDPHSQAFGFFYGHIGWALFDYPDRGKSRMALVAPMELRQDPVVRFFEAHHAKLFIASCLFFWALGGIPMLLWAGFLRTVFCLHFAFCVNSINHRFGYRNFDTPDKSTNSWWVALLTWGEGWHNNHHRSPQSVRHGLKWWELDLSYGWIRLLDLCGLVWDVKTAEKNSPAKPVPSEVA